MSSQTKGRSKGKPAIGRGRRRREAPPLALDPGTVENAVTPHPMKKPSPKKSVVSDSKKAPSKNLASGGKNIGSLDEAETAMREAFASRGMVVIPAELAGVAGEFVRCGPWLSAALEHSWGLYSLASVFEAILAKDMLLWPGRESAVVTQLVEFPTGKRMTNYLLGGGSGEEIRVMLRDVELYAAANGCDGVMLTGRKGWARSFLAEDGYEARWQVMTKEIHHV